MPNNRRATHSQLLLLSTPNSRRGGPIDIANLNPRSMAIAARIPRFHGIAAVVALLAPAPRRA